jgi:transposase, IS5 family
VRKGTIIDAIIIGSATNGDGEAAWVKHRARQPAHGVKAHSAGDKDSGIIRAVETTPANEAGVAIAPGLDPGASLIPNAPGGVLATRPMRRCRLKRRSRPTEARSFCAKAIAGFWPKSVRRIIASSRPIRARIEKIFGTWKHGDRLRAMARAC